MPNVTVPAPEPLPNMEVRCPTCGKVMPGGEYPAHWTKEHVPAPRGRP